MKKFVSVVIAATSLVFVGAVAANAGTINIHITATGSSKILLDGSACTNCTRSSVQQIMPDDTGTSYAVSKAGAMIATYSVKYYNLYGRYFTKKGCEASITVSLDVFGKITGIITRSNMSVYPGPASCYNSSPVISLDGYDVDWSVRMGAS